jgi:hypothetical protein
MFSPLVPAELRARGHGSVAIKEREEWQSLSDPEVIALARTEERAVVTANLRDFRPLHAELVAPGTSSSRNASGGPYRSWTAALTVDPSQQATSPSPTSATKYRADAISGVLRSPACLPRV